MERAHTEGQQQRVQGDERARGRDDDAFVIALRSQGGVPMPEKCRLPAT
jgi:hypothetical protein